MASALHVRAFLTTLVFVITVSGVSSCDCSACDSCCFVALPGDCESYCFCKRYNKNEVAQQKRKCPDGQRFNRETLNCDSRDTTSCDIIPPPPEGFKCEQELNSHPDACNVFIHCSNGIPVSKLCPPGLHFCNSTACPEKPRCEYPEKANCPNGHLNCGEGQFYPNPASCKSYYQCANNKLILHSCPENLHFCLNCNPPRCEFPDMAMCSPQVLHNYSFQDREVTYSPDVAGQRVLVMSRYFSAPLRCPLPTGLYPVPAEPSLYVRCTYQREATFYQCPVREVFDPTLNACVGDRTSWIRRLTPGECRA